MTALTELKKLAELQWKATQGPWKAICYPRTSGWCVESNYDPEGVSDVGICEMSVKSDTRGNAEYIAASRNIDLPALVAYVEGLEAFAMSVIYQNSDNGLSIGARKALGRSE